METQNYFAELFGNPEGLDPAETAAGVAAAQAAERARLDDLAAANEARRLEAVRMRCPRCAGSGFLPQFQHRKGGECFACGATGVRAAA